MDTISIRNRACTSPDASPQDVRAARTLSPLLLLRSYTEMRETFRLLTTISLAFLILAALAFAEPFVFWSLPLSDLGALHTPGGKPNYPSFVLFALSMISGSLLTTRYAALCVAALQTPHRTGKILLAACAAVGFVVGIFPHDRFPVLHTAGCATMVGSLWFLANLFTLELVRAHRRRDALCVQVILQATVLPYAAAYFADSEIKQALQKFAIAGLYTALTLATGRLRSSVLEVSTRRLRPNGGSQAVSG